MRSKAAIFTGIGQPLVVDEIEVRDPGPGECLVKLEATGLCHTEIWYMGGGDNVDYDQLSPRILGHEGGGVVVKAGSAVTSLKEGDHVVPLYIAECGGCPECKSPETNLCSYLDDKGYYEGVMPDGQSRFEWQGKPAYHFMGTSTFSQYTVVPEVALAKVRPDAPLDRVCLLGCAITTGVGAVLWTARPQPGASMAIFGCGPIGLNVIQGAKLALAEKIIAVDLKPERLEMAKKLGATHLINAGDYDGNAVPAVKELTGGGADFSFEATGNTTVMRQAFESVCYGGGKCVLIGVAKTGEVVSLVPRMLIAGRQLTGTAFGNAKGRTQLPWLVDWYMDGRLKIDELVTREIPLEKINDAFGWMKADQGYRYVVKYGE
jgi:S-(hydroxymethyl)glutathione dehydrogenase / alcohol dehydrogenase